MIVTCNECDTSFNFPEKYIKDSGTKVRCSKCRKVFSVFPSTPIAPNEAAVENRIDAPAVETQKSAPEPAVSDEPETLSGLDDLDLNAIENMLDLDAGGDGAVTAEPASQPDDLELNFELDDGPALDSEPDIEPGQNQELELPDLGLDTDISSGSSGGVSEELDLELDFGAESASDSDDDIPVGKAMDAGPDGSEELSLDLDFDFDTPEVTTGTDNGPAEDATEDLGFDLDLNFDDAEKGEETIAAVQMDQTEGFNLDDIDDLLDLEDASEEVVSDELTEDLAAFDLDLDDDPQADGKEAADAGSEDLDFSLDLDLDAEPDATPVSDDDLIADEPLDDLDFELDIESDEAVGEPNDAMDAEETAELDLSELEDIIDDDAGASDDSADAVEDVDFELDLDFDGEQGATPAEKDIIMDETEDLDLSGLDEALEIEQAADMPADDEDDLEDLDLDLDLDDEALETDDEGSPEEDFELTDLDEMLVDDGESEDGEEAGSAADDFGLELDLSDTAEDSSGSDELDDGEFDLSDMDDMLEMDEPEASAEEQLVSPDDDLDLDMPYDDAVPAEGQEEEAADIELDFDMDDDETAPGAVPASAAVGQAGDALAGSFDMGTLPGAGASFDSDEEAETDFAMQDDEDLSDETPPKKGGLLRTLLMLLILIGGGYGAMIVAQAAGIAIPYVPELPGSRMPFLTNLVGGDSDELGNLKITIMEPTLDGEFVDNAKLGPLFVIKGQVQNSYDQPRNFIQVTGKIYTKGRKKSMTETVFAGNSISAADLERLSQAAITKRLGNRFGDKRSNMNLKTGKSIPFMIVFSNLPKNLDEYTVEVAASKMAKK